MSSLLTSTKVTKRFGGLTAVRDLDFELEENAIASIIGPNGAGKTTFFNCLSGYYIADEGTIVYDGIEIQKMRPDEVAHLAISRTYQNIRLFASMTAMENVLVGQHNHLRSTWLGAIIRTPAQRREEEAAHQEARRLLEFVGLRGRGDDLAVKLPYGAQRRLEVARALANKPRLLLLDEPTAGMNPAESAQMTEFIRRLRGELGITILLIEHEMRVVMGISDRVTVLDHGEKIAEGTPREIQQDPRVIEAYLGRGGAEAAAETTQAREAAAGGQPPTPPAPPTTPQSPAGA